MNQKGTILIVDDDFNNLKVLGSLLRGSGYNVEAASGGKNALEVLEDIIPDLILLDAMMPELDGFDTCKLIRKEKKFDSIPILFVSALNEIEQMVKGIELGAVDFILKPFNSKLLLSKIKIHLDLKHKTQALKELTGTLERKVAERTRELEAANKELKKLDEVKTEFLQIISHEIRTPLNGILGFTEILRTEKDCDKTLHYLDILDRSAKRLEHFSLNALLYTQLRTKNYHIHPQSTPVKAMLDSALSKISPKAEKKKIAFSFEMDENIVVKADEPLMVKCFGNILDNAIKFSRKDSKIIIRGQKQDEKISIQIKDTGKGFSEKALSGLFKPFSPGEMFVDTNEGIDLALCKLIMEKHNGEIWVNNMERGASVNLVFNA